MNPTEWRSRSVREQPGRVRRVQSLTETEAQRHEHEHRALPRGVGAQPRGFRRRRRRPVERIVVALRRGRAGRRRTSAQPMHFGRVDDFGRRQVHFERPGKLVVVVVGGRRRLGVRRGLARRAFGPRADVTMHAREITQHARRARRTVPLARELVVEQPELHDVVDRVDGPLAGLICEPSREPHPARVRPQLGARDAAAAAPHENGPPRARALQSRPSAWRWRACAMSTCDARSMHPQPASESYLYGRIGAKSRR